MPHPKTLNKSERIPPRSQQVKEILKCGSDPNYFINRYIKIPTENKGVVRFNTFPFQDKCLEEFIKNRYVIVNKSRQLGLSTICAAYALWMALFQKHKNVLVIATKLETAKLFLSKVEAMLSTLPNWLVIPDIKAKAVRYIKFSNGSEIHAIPTSPDAGRGYTLSLLIVDEAAHVDDIEELWLGLQPTLSAGGSVILISTPSGVGTLFHRLWEGAKNSKNDFCPIELPWNVHPERDETWFQEQCRAIIEAKGERGIYQELLCSFSASGDTFLKPELMDLIFSEVKEPIETLGPADSTKKDVWVWVQPKSGHKYIMAADIARGDGEDFSTFHVIDIDADEVVAEYKGKIAPDKFADLMMQVAMKYNMAMICPERNSIGLVTCMKLKESKYPNLFYDKLHKNIYMVYTNKDLENEMPGFETNAKTRVEIFAQLETVLRNRRLKTYSKRLYEELQTFVWKKSRPQALKGYNDDLILALAICNSLYAASGVNTVSSDDMAKALLAGMSVATNTLEGNNVANNPQEQYPPIMTGTSLRDFIEKTKTYSLSNKTAHNYNDPFWKQFGWIFKD